MYFHSFEPVLPLQQDVKCIWAFEESQADHNRVPVLPDTNVEVIFNCGSPYAVQLDNGTMADLPRVFLNGLQKKPIHLRVAGTCQFIAIRLHGWATRLIVDLPDDPYTLPVTPLTTRWQDFARTIEYAVRCYGYQEAAAQLQQFVMDGYRPQQDFLTIRQAGEKLYTTGGQMRLSELAAESNLSQRQFERRFKHWMGISPKAYARLIRHEAAREALFHNPDTDLVTLAQEYGYSDQAHFTHEFKRFATQTPHQYAMHVRATAWRK
ncbi:MAG: helix-turn-helix domain-containing protein [Chloroflexota bacterium]